MTHWEVRFLRPGGGIMLFGVQADTQLAAARTACEVAGVGVILELTRVLPVGERLQSGEERFTVELWEQKKLKGSSP